MAYRAERAAAAVRAGVEGVDGLRGVLYDEEIVARGYAALAFWNGDVAVDNARSNCTQGVHACWAKERTASTT